MPRAKKTPTEIPAVTTPAEVGNPHVAPEPARKVLEVPLITEIGDVITSRRYIPDPVNVATTEPDTALTPEPVTPGEAQVLIPAVDLDHYRTTIAEQSARIAELEAQVDPPGWRESRAYRDGLALDDIRCAILDTGHPLGDDTDPELTPLRLVKEVLAKVAALESELAAYRKAPTEPPPPARPVATWMGDVLLTPGGKVLGRVNVSRGPLGHLQAAPIYYPGEDQERMGPMGTLESAREWVSEFARKIGWTVA